MSISVGTMYTSSQFVGIAIVAEVTTAVVRVDISDYDGNVTPASFSLSDVEKWLALGVWQLHYSWVSPPDGWNYPTSRQIATYTSIPQITCPTQLLHADAQAPLASDEFAGASDIFCVGGLGGLLDDVSKYDPNDVAMWQQMAISPYCLAPGESRIFRTGFAQAIQPGWLCLLWDRSGMGANKKVHRLAGVIDSNYRGEWFVALTNLSQQPVMVAAGDRIVQGVYQRQVRAHCPLVNSLTSTERGANGLGSTGA